jgi:diguanylate cyclase (GGDEF)-like protein
VVLMMDLDNFKLVNDQAGHLEGDRLLERVSRILKESVREMDFVARYAGDEFVVVLPRGTAETAEEVVQRIRRAVTHFAWNSGQPELGVSIGRAGYPADGTDAKRLLGVADGRMYADKSSRKKERSALMVQGVARSDSQPSVGSAS